MTIDQEEYIRQIEIAQKWRIRFYIANKILNDLKVSDAEELEKLINLRTELLLERWKLHERWWEMEPEIEVVIVGDAKL